MRARICSMICSTFTESERTLKSGITCLQGSINQQRHGHRPQRDAYEQRPIRKEQLGGIAASFPPVHEIEVPEDSIQRKWNREPQPRRPELLLRLGADRVADVGQ